MIFQPLSIFLVLIFFVACSSKPHRKPLFVENPAPKPFLKPDPLNIPATPNSFSVGATMDEVAAIMGTPQRITNYSSISETIWYYDFSSVKFKDGCVREWDNNGGNLKVAWGKARQVNMAAALPPNPLRIQSYFPPQVILVRTAYVFAQEPTSRTVTQAKLEAGRTVKVISVSGSNLSVESDLGKHSLPIDVTDFLDRVIAEADKQ